MARPAQLQMGDTKRSTWSEICISHKEILSYLASSAFYPFANKNLQQQQQNIQRGSVSWCYRKKKKKKEKKITRQHCPVLFKIPRTKQNKNLNLRDILICLKPEDLSWCPFSCIMMSQRWNFIRPWYCIQLKNRSKIQRTSLVEKELQWDPEPTYATKW